VSFQSIGDTANRVRGIELESVLRILGAKQDRHDNAEWHTEKGAISVTGRKFMSWSQAVGGGGAIDLAIHLCDLDFKGAVAWLSGNFTWVEPSQKAQCQAGKGLQLPPRNEGKLHAVWRYLAQERCLPTALLEPLIQCGSLYADFRGNAVFLLLGDKNEPVGAEIRGTTPTPWRGMAAGTRKDRGYFSVRAPSVSAIVLCESAIDAVSCLALYPETWCISTAGARPEPGWLPEVTRGERPVYCGFDADLAGDNMSQTMIAKYPAIRRLRPACKDWNDVLRSQS
jgi:hypothetical protein